MTTPTMKYASVDFGTAEAVFNKLGGLDGIQRFLRGELIVAEPVRRWREQDGVIYFSVTSDGTTGAQWIKRLEKKGYQVDGYAKSVLLSPDFQPTTSVTYEVAVLKGELFADRDRITNIHAQAGERQLITPNAELACLIRENFTDEELKAMDLWAIITMHQPIIDSSRGLLLLGASRSDSGRWLDAFDGHPDNRWNIDYGFVFVVSQRKPPAR